MGDETLEKRVNELEIRLSFQDSTVASLDSVLRAQQQEIETLKARIEHFIKQKESAGEGVRADFEKPPHY